MTPPALAILTAAGPAERIAKRLAPQPEPGHVSTDYQLARTHGLLPGSARAGAS